MPDFSRKASVGESIPTSSMADIAFLLLIFFMVTTVFVRYRVTGIVLPKAEKIEELKKRLLVMGGLAEELVRLAVKGLTDRDSSLVSQVVKGDQPINDLHIEIDDRCFKLLALKQPMATDLRAIVAAFKINTDLERVGDLAINLVEATKR